MKEMLWKDAQEYIKNNKDIIYLCFSTVWCGDCQMMLPIIESVEQKFLSNKEVSFIKVDAEESKLFRIDSEYKVMRVPTHVFIKNSEIKEIMYEYVDEEILIMEIDKLRYEK